MAHFDSLLICTVLAAVLSSDQLGGGEEAGSHLIQTLPRKFRLKEYSRNFINRINRYNFLTNLSYSKCELIIATTTETADKLPRSMRSKTIVRSAIGINTNENRPTSSSKKFQEFSVLYAGVLVHWKGVHLAVKAFSLLLKKHPNASLTIIGTGPFGNYLKKLVREEGIASFVQFKSWCKQEELWNYYSSCDVFLFPSFHDSGGFVVLEAMSFGKPVICLDSGAPSNYVGYTNNVIKSNQHSSKIVDDIVSRLLALKDRKDEYREESLRVQQRVKQFQWDKVVGEVYDSVILPIQ